MKNKIIVNTCESNHRINTFFKLEIRFNTLQSKNRTHHFCYKILLCVCVISVFNKYSKSLYISRCFVYLCLSVTQAQATTHPYKSISADYVYPTSSIWEDSWSFSMYYIVLNTFLEFCEYMNTCWLHRLFLVYYSVFSFSP